MESNTLIRKVHMSCPLCNKAHEIEERKRTTSIILKGEEVTYEERFYFVQTRMRMRTNLKPEQ